MRTFFEYQDKARDYAFYPTDMLIVYPVLGLVGEAGEVADKIKKVYRDNYKKFDKEHCKEIAQELGDVLWYLANLASDLGYSLEDIADMNIEKLSSRKERGTLSGNGDNR